MYPITHVPHPPRYPISICSINHDTPLTMFAIAHVSYVMPMYPIGHVPHHPCAPSPKVPHLYLQYWPWHPFDHVCHCPCVLSYTHVPHCPCTPLAMCPITHVPHPPRYPISICSINHDTPLTMFAIAHVSYVMPMYPIGHVPHHPCAPSPKVPHLYLQY